MSILSMREAIKTTIASELADSFNTVDTYGGRFNLEELRRWAGRAPAALVACLGGTSFELFGGEKYATIRWAVFVLTTSRSVVPRDDAALALVESVAALVLDESSAAAGRWGEDDAGPIARGAIENLYTGGLDKSGVSLWAVTWLQNTLIDKLDAEGLDDFDEAWVDWDLAPRDGQLDAQDLIKLRSDIMSALGRIYVSASSPTSIAAADTYYKAAGTTTLDTAPTAESMDMPANGRLRHTGSVAKPFLVQAVGSVEASGACTVHLALAKNGVVDETTEVELDLGATTPVGFSLTDFVQLDEDEYCEVWLKSSSDSVTVTLNKLSLVAAAT